MFRGGVERKVKIVQGEGGVNRKVKVVIGGVMYQKESNDVDLGSDVSKGK